MMWCRLTTLFQFFIFLVRQSWVSETGTKEEFFCSTNVGPPFKRTKNNFRQEFSTMRPNTYCFCTPNTVGWIDF